MARKANPFKRGRNWSYQQRLGGELLKKQTADPQLRPDELQLQDEQGADYKRRKDRINSPFRTIVF